MSKFTIRSSNVVLASIGALLLGTAVGRSLGPAPAFGQDEPSRLRGLANERVVPVAPSDTLQVQPGETLPNNDATDVPVDTLLRIGFDNAPALGGGGTIRIYRASDQVVVDTIDLRDPYAIYDGSVGRLTTHLTSSKLNIIGGLRSGIDEVRVVNYVPVIVNGNTATIYPHNNKLAYGTQYYVMIEDGVLEGAIDGEQFTGVAANEWTFATKATAPTTYNVAEDNSAEFATVQGAIDAVPAGNRSPVTINIAPGVYQELLFIRNKHNVTLRGTDSVETVIQYENCDGFNPGTGASQRVTSPGEGGTLPPGPLSAGGRAVFLMSAADLLTLDSITLKNTHAQGSTTLLDGTLLREGLAFVNYRSAITQAETIYFNTGFSSSTPAARLVAKHSNFVSYQDTIQVKGWSWFYDCFITGDVDFIWGNANAALFERCEIKSRFRRNPAYIVQSRAYLGFGGTSTPPDYNRSYPGFVFLNSALTKEDGVFTSYLARSPGAPAVHGNAPTYYYYNYDIVAFINSTMDSHIPALGWFTPGPNVVGNAVTGWREYGSFTPDDMPMDVSNRLSRTSSPPSTTGHDSIQLTSADIDVFFANRALILSGATNGTWTTTGYPGGWNPQP
jgi:pectin methylesterase-like acyl-CoA thioesterase